MAEIELSVLKGQCLKRRILDMATMQTEVGAWEKKNRNNSTKKISWQFTTPDARIKLKRLIRSCKDYMVLFDFSGKFYDIKISIIHQYCPNIGFSKNLIWTRVVINI